MESCSPTPGELATKRPRLYTERLKDPAPVGSTWADWLTALCKNKCHLPVPRTSEHLKVKRSPAGQGRPLTSSLVAQNHSQFAQLAYYVPRGEKRAAKQLSFALKSGGFTSQGLKSGNLLASLTNSDLMWSLRYQNHLCIFKARPSRPSHTFGWNEWMIGPLHML